MPKGIYPRKVKSIKERFWSMVDESAGPDGCWPWKRAKSTRGYGRFTVKKGHFVQAHRMAWELTYGPIPEGLNALHKCDNRPCCNPKHLWLGTCHDNTMDMMAKGRNSAKTHPERIARGDRSGPRKHPERMPRGDRNGARTHPEKVARGERSGTAILTEQQVLEIRAKYAQGNITYAKLGEEFGTDFTNIYLIVKRKHWKHI